jgi:hypothetical protein
MNRLVLSLISLVIITTGCKTKKQLVIPAKQKLEIWTKKSSVNEAFQYEKLLSNQYNVLEKSVSLSNSVYPQLDNYEIAQPLIIKRVNNEFLPVFAEYFFSVPDSTLRYVSYDWEKGKYGNYNDKPEMWKEESTKIDEYNEKYEKLKNELINNFGQPIEQDKKPEITKSKYSDSNYLSRNTVWEDDKIFAKLNLVFASNTYRIRLNYYWKN